MQSIDYQLITPPIQQYLLPARVVCISPRANPSSLG
jgi:hypothetical protein